MRKAKIKFTGGASRRNKTANRKKLVIYTVCCMLLFAALCGRIAYQMIF
ncbi:MAG: hypothetical protein K2K87_04690 [Lachnospiraceae bacterium]|nr:hypothetical protein [Lachnospiraceae bacterium]